MSDTCPKCGAILWAETPDGLRLYDCGTRVGADGTDESTGCLRRQLAQRDERLAELLEACEAAAALLPLACTCQDGTIGSGVCAACKATNRARAAIAKTKEATA